MSETLLLIGFIALSILLAFGMWMDSIPTSEDEPVTEARKARGE